MTTPPPVDVALDTLVEGARVRGFTAKAVFLDGADQPIGARFVHDTTKFVVDYLRVETAPQGFLWVNSFPTSDKGEPHTQEHLLLGKGDRGRRFGSTEAMALAESSAFTAQWRTAYHFHTVAGHDVYWSVFENQLDAMLNPDYTDEEIRREVRNFGVDKGDDGKLRLEEKGTVYNEMVRAHENPQTGMWRAAGQLVYGATHPLAFDSGGYPDAIRTMTVDDIRKFHRENYHLANMGVIAAFPKAMSLTSVLDRTAAILDKAGTRTGKASSEAELPKPAAAQSGRVEVVEYPYNDAGNPGPMMLAWPATRSLDEAERLLLGLFLDAFAGDESTTLYKKLIDGKTRVTDLGASGVWTYTNDDQGQPIYLGLNGVKADLLHAKTVADVRILVLAELERIAKLPAGNAELVAFGDRVKSRVIDLQRRYNKFLDSPPGFGIRGTGSGWMDHLHSLMRSGGFKKSLTMRPALARVQAILDDKSNPWRERLRAWGLLDTPFGVAAKPSPAKRTQLDTERKQRIDAELARLQKHYGTADAAATLARYQQDYDAETKRLEDSAKVAELPPLVESLPMTLDDGLQYETGEIGNVKTFVATFDSMASVRVQLAFNLSLAVPPDAEMYLAALPSLLGDAGVIVHGTPIAADEMRERLRNEVLELSVHYITSNRLRRSELVVAGAGNGVVETRTALEWMQRVMFSPDWRVENLPRLRDLVDQRLTGLRQRMLGSEEGWVHDPRDAWRQQSRVQARVASFLTQQHDLHRLRWQLLGEPSNADAVKFIASLGEASKLPRAQLLELAQALAKLDGKAKPKAARWYAAAMKLSASAKPIAQAAGKDLALILSDIPDNSLAKDWVYLAKQMSADLAKGPAHALAKLLELRQQLIQSQRARLVQVGSRASHDALASSIELFARKLQTPQQTNGYGERIEKPFLDRLREREPNASPTFVGFLAPGTSSGVFLNTVSSTQYGDTSDDAILDYLTSNLYTGHGGHSMFMKTWAAGLAYSNGLRRNLEDGILLYYAERTPLLPTTLKFVIEQLRKAKPDPNIARYAIAQAFDSRVAEGYEERANAMAANLADGQSADVVRAFRKRILEFAKRPDLAEVLFRRMEAVYGKVLPGYAKPNPDTTYFVIGPEKQLAAYEDYLRATFGNTTKLYRLYPRDFWIPAK